MNEWLGKEFIDWRFSVRYRKILMLQRERDMMATDKGEAA